MNNNSIGKQMVVNHLSFDEIEIRVWCSLQNLTEAWYGISGKGVDSYCVSQSIMFLR